ncbi:DUF732 domain-containing protein [Pseudonocardia xishanensis]|uniref:DUF732 domain-containing protein n=1 Tax=Pseudonocardia xishanensis TaxID=630995 RepID=A0ABP8RMB8_9PSEU
MTQPPQQQPYGTQQIGAYGPTAGFPYQGAPGYGTGIPQQRQPEPPRRKRWWIPVVAVLAVIAVVTVLAVLTTSGDSTTVAAPASAPAVGEAGYLQTVRAVAPELSKFDDPTLATIGRAVCSQPSSQSRQLLITDMASYRSISTGAAGTIVTAAVQYFCPSRTWASQTGVVTTAAPTTTAVVASGPAKAITAREWLLIAKDPDAHQGERVIVYGEVRQFDSATGPSGFRANVDGVVHPVKYGYANYETNTVLGAGTGVSLAEVVQDDLFKAEVTVVGSYSYDTQIGGKTTVPMLLITNIEVTGSTAG